MSYKAVSQASSATGGARIVQSVTPGGTPPWTLGSIFVVRADVENKGLDLVSQVRSQNGNLAIESNELANITGATRHQPGTRIGTGGRRFESRRRGQCR